MCRCGMNNGRSLTVLMHVSNLSIILFTRVYSGWDWINTTDCENYNIFKYLAFFATSTPYMIGSNDYTWFLLSFVRCSFCSCQILIFRGDTLSLQTRAEPPTIYQIHAMPPTILVLPSSVPVFLLCPGQISIQNRAFVRRPSLYLFWTIHYKSQYRSISSKLFVIFSYVTQLINL